MANVLRLNALRHYEEGMWTTCLLTCNHLVLVFLSLMCALASIVELGLIWCCGLGSWL